MFPIVLGKSEPITRTTWITKASIAVVGTRSANQKLFQYDSKKYQKATEQSHRTYKVSRAPPRYDYISAQIALSVAIVISLLVTTYIDDDFYLQPIAIFLLLVYIRAYLVPN